jgi:hypothetical protein
MLTSRGGAHKEPTGAAIERHTLEATDNFREK